MKWASRLARFKIFFVMGIAVVATSFYFTPIRAAIKHKVHLKIGESLDFYFPNIG